MTLHPAAPAVLIALSAACVAAQGQTPPPAPPAAGSPSLPLWEVGVGALGASQQAYPGASERVNRGLALPFFIYRGDILRADRESVGLRAIKTRDFELDVGLAGSFGSDGDDVEARRGMPDLGTLVELGPRLKWNLGQGPAGGRLRADVALRGVFDISDGFGYRGLSFEPKLVYENRSGPWRWGTSIATVIGNQRLADHFYGVAPVYATPTRRAYQADAGLITLRLGATATRELSRDWRVFGFARLDSVAGAANRNSPLVRKDLGASAGIGLIYTFARSERLVSD